jgi:hypothetical protein
LKDATLIDDRKTIQNKREMKAGVTWITRFFLKRALVCSRRLAPMALVLVRPWRSQEEIDALTLMLHSRSPEETGFELRG